MRAIPNSLRWITWQSWLAASGRVQQNLQQLRKEQYLSTIETTSLQNERLKALLLHSYRNVTYYRELLKEHGVIREDQTVDLTRFSQLPMLDKPTLKENFEELKSSDLPNRRWKYTRSGGSTGYPAVFIQDKPFKDYELAAKLLFDEWTGYRTPQTKVLLWGSETDLMVGRRTFKSNAGQWARNETWLNAFMMGPDEMKQYIAEIERCRPRQILAYADCIHQLARFIEREGVRLSHRPHSIMTSAWTLEASIRETIEQVFGCPVFNRYGSKETGDIACDCEQHAGLHICSTTQYVEVIGRDGKPAKPGEVGEIVITPLLNYAMPLIRYRIGDLGVIEEGTCSCGRHWPRLREVSGRTGDSFVSRDGGYVSPIVLVGIVSRFLRDPAIAKAQLVQEDYELFHLNLQLASRETSPVDQAAGLTEETRRMIEVASGKFQQIMGYPCEFVTRFVDQIEPTSSGKTRYVYSKVSHD